MPNDRIRRIGGVCGILGILIFMAFLAISVSGYTGYNIISNHLSDLGVGETAFLFNMGVVISGLLFAFLGGAFLLSGNAKTTKFGGLLLSAASAFLMFIGIFPKDQMLAHLLVTSLFFSLSVFAMLLFAYGLKTSKSFSYYSCFASIPSVIFLVSRLPIIEHIAVLALGAWMSAASLMLYRKPISSCPQ